MRGSYLSQKTGKTERYDSGYELARFRALDESDLVKSWTKDHGIQISYRDGKKRRRYLPDIYVEYHDGRRFLEEVKGRVFDWIQFSGKNLAAVMWSHRTGVVFRTIFKEDLGRVE